MKVLITGGTGFIGFALARRIKSLGHDVTSFSRSEYSPLADYQIEPVIGDISDYNKIYDAIEKSDIVFHTAAKVGMYGRYSDFYRSNVTGTENIIKACLNSGVRHLIFTSSASVIFDGNSLEGVDESTGYPKKPVSNYLSTKAIAEKLILDANSDALKTISLRPHIVWGPDDRHIIPKIISSHKSGRLKKIGKQNPITDSTFIDNAIDAHICAMDAIVKKPDSHGRAYFITDNNPQPVWNLINMFLRSANLTEIEGYIPKKIALSLAWFIENIYSILKSRSEPALTRFIIHELTTPHWFNISAAIETLNYRPKVGWDEGEARTREWLKKL